MATCTAVTKEVLKNPVNIQVDENDLDFKRARIIADKKAGEIAAQPMLLSWYEKSSGRFSPNVTCCSEEKPGWVVYAESRGGEITLDINYEAYVFIYGDSSFPRSSVVTHTGLEYEMRCSKFPRSYFTIRMHSHGGPWERENELGSGIQKIFI